MRILITGANGFIGKNLQVRLSENPDFDTSLFTREDSQEALTAIATDVDAVIHLAGVNRPTDEQEFISGNRDFTAVLCETLKGNEKPVHILFASSIQAAKENPYGASKLAAEQVLADFAEETGNAVSIFRLPNVFGKWCMPEYNSVVATFCHHIANDMPIDIHDPATRLRLVYIDDVVEAFLHALESRPQRCDYVEVTPEYEISLGELAETLYRFHGSRSTLLVDNVGVGLTRALYATYLSYLPPDRFSFPLQAQEDDRGKFVEVLKTAESGQFSFFTAGPGITRGGHYHHTKNEKFLVVHGEALFRFRHLVDNRHFEIRTSADKPVLVESIPGWAHDLVNTGDGELVVMLWANEIFDKDKPDTIRALIDE